MDIEFQMGAVYCGAWIEEDEGYEVPKKKTKAKAKPKAKGSKSASKAKAK